MYIFLRRYAEIVGIGLSITTVSKWVRGVDGNTSAKHAERVGFSRAVQFELENPHCFCSISICFVMRMAFSA
jgi:hypothetical protein